MPQLREFNFWAYADRLSDPIVVADGTTGLVIGEFPLEVGELANVNTRTLIYLGTDGAGGAFFEDLTDKSVGYVSDSKDLNSGDVLPVTSLKLEPLPLDPDEEVDFPVLSIVPDVADQDEGDVGSTDFTFTVIRSGNVDSESSVEVSKTGGTSGSDDTGGVPFPITRINFAPGETQQTVTYSVSGDTDVEPDETITLELGKATDATIDQTAASATGTIRNDDGDNSSPVAADDSYETDEGVDLNVATAEGVLANDTDPDGDDLSVNSTLVDDADNGSVTINAQGAFLYEPNDGFNGTDSFTYEVTDNNGGTDTATATITVNAVNQEPVAADDGYDIDEDGTLTIAVAEGILANDTDADGDPLSAVLDDDVDNGSLTLSDDGSFTYTPNADFNGTDSFTYFANDDTEDSAAPATVTITVNSVNDAPVAADDSYETDEGVDLNVATAEGVLANDTDPEGDDLSVNSTLVDDADNGTVTINAQGAFLYEPNDGFNGTDSFTYEVTDNNGGTATATATITVNAVNEAPVAADDGYDIDEDGTLTIAVAEGILANDTDADGDPLSAVLDDDVDNGSLTLSDDGSFTYTPNADFNGTDSFTYFANDGTEDSAAPATVTLTVNSVNDAPVAADDSYETDEGVDLNVATAEGVLANDTDPDGDDLSVVATLVDEADNGTVTINNVGGFTYAPDDGFNGTDSFTYEVTDNNGGTATATATITVGEPAAAPVVSIAPLIADQNEGNSGTTSFSFLVTRSGDDLSGTSSVEVAFDAGDTDADDFADGLPTTQTVNFAANEAVEVITVDVRGDSSFEADETFSLNLQKATGAEISDTANTADGTIVNDDEEGPDLFNVTITFKSADAAWQNAFGVYFENGEPLSEDNPYFAEVLAHDTKALTEGDVVYDVDLTQEQVDSLEFFLASDANRLNDGLDSVVNAFSQVVDTADGADVSAAVKPLGRDPLAGRGAPAVFSDQTLNPDDFDHFRGDEVPSNDFMLEIEDVVGGGDSDFNDAVFQVQITPVDDGPPIDSGDFNLIEGTDAKDFLTGTRGNDLIRLFARTDVAEGRDGDDILDGGTGDDVLYGDDGDDILDGDQGTDILNGGAGNDTILGGLGGDVMSGGTGRDILIGGEGNDFIAGQGGNDILTGGEGNDLFDFSGPFGDDIITDYDDTRDRLIFEGAAGSISTEVQSNGTLITVDDPETFGTVFLLGVTDLETEGAGQANAVIVNDDAEGDDGFGNFLDLSERPEPQSAALEIGGTDFNVIEGTDAKDFLVGTRGNDLFHLYARTDVAEGRDGDDILDGGTGDDVLYGDDGDDILDGDQGTDILNGGAGNDTILGGLGGDVMSGGTGRDILIGGEGNDFIAGQGGNDILTGGEGNDLFDFSGPFGDDIITDYDDTRDRLIFEGAAGSISTEVQSNGTLITVDDPETFGTVFLLGVTDLEIA